ncbi:Uncharacterised protein [Acinetobacter baumannii]|nr:Uncharacterised protein [Acinetobacter baumannii]
MALTTAKVNKIQQNGHDHPGQQQIASFIASSFQRSKIVSAVPGRYDNSQRDDDLPDRLAETGDAAYATKAEDNRNTVKRITHQPSPQTCGSAK